MSSPPSDITMTVSPRHRRSEATHFWDQLLDGDLFSDLEAALPPVAGQLFSQSSFETEPPRSTLDPAAPAFIPRVPFPDTSTGCIFDMSGCTCDPSGCLAGSDMFDTSDPSGYMFDTSAALGWDKLDPVPPTTLAEGRCEARTLANWGTVPYVIVDEGFKSAHSYPLVQIGCTVTSLMQTEIDLDTLFCVESEDPFTLFLDNHYFASAPRVSYGPEETHIVQAVHFPDGLPMFKLLESGFSCRTNTLRDQDLHITIFGEVYDATSPYMPVPNSIRIAAPDYLGIGATIWVRHGRLSASDRSQDEVDDDAKDETGDLDQCRPLSEHEIREYYEALPVRDFLKLEPDVQEAAMELLVAPPKVPTRRTRLAEQLTTAAFSLENWTRTDPDGDRDGFELYKDAIVQCLDNLRTTF